MNDVTVSQCTIQYSFLRASAMLNHVIDIGWTSARPSSDLPASLLLFPHPLLILHRLCSAPHNIRPQSHRFPIPQPSVSLITACTVVQALIISHWPYRKWQISTPTARKRFTRFWRNFIQIYTESAVSTTSSVSRWKHKDSTGYVIIVYFRFS